MLFPEPALYRIFPGPDAHAASTTEWVKRFIAFDNITLLGTDTRHWTTDVLR